MNCSVAKTTRKVNTNRKNWDVDAQANIKQVTEDINEKVKLHDYYNVEWRNEAILHSAVFGAKIMDKVQIDGRLIKEILIILSISIIYSTELRPMPNSHVAGPPHWKRWSCWTSLLLRPLSTATSTPSFSATVDGASKHTEISP